MLEDYSSQQIRTPSCFRSAAQPLSTNLSHPPRLNKSSTGQSAAYARTALCLVPLRQRSVHRSQSAIAWTVPTSPLRSLAGSVHRDCSPHCLLMQRQHCSPPAPQDFATSTHANPLPADPAPVSSANNEKAR